ncbi:hypothetical protein GCM10011416_14640 [Polaribacter pacificus]|uniref:Uncharacterized protein n=1 Tax=Polaribacter pacificus TaxID=1775173 RepID=A0A917ME32_9FLAO|nr:hypothetical protein [Polaribacter pacificus]GGG97669.1 hypothetical protein GCM10011416_14640 [Polaribacter pacificus]
MENKNRYLKALAEDNGQLNEIDLGEKYGLDEDETRSILAQLLAEHSIEYIENKACNYSLIKNRKRKTI